jgi:hypothetical protein
VLAAAAAAASLHPPGKKEAMAAWYERKVALEVARIASSPQPMSSWMPGDPIVSGIVEHPIVFAAVAVTSFAAAYVILPRVSVLWRSVVVRLGLSSQLNDKICTFITQHSKNMQEAEKNPSYAFSIINSPALVANSHRIAVGILPDDSLLADIKRSSLTKGENGAVRQLAVLSVVEQFELDTEFDFM